MIERISIIERVQLVEMRTNHEKNNPEDGVLDLECQESCNYEVSWMKTCNSMTNFTDYKYKDQKK